VNCDFLDFGYDGMTEMRYSYESRGNGKGGRGLLDVGFDGFAFNLIVSIGLERKSNATCQGGGLSWIPNLERKIGYQRGRYVTGSQLIINFIRTSHSIESRVKMDANNTKKNTF
jgi:hypothetical protein